MGENASREGKIPTQGSFVGRVVKVRIGEKLKFVILMISRSGFQLNFIISWCHTDSNFKPGSSIFFPTQPVIESCPCKIPIF